MEGNWRDCRQCRRSFGRVSVNTGDIRDVGSHGMREPLTGDGSLQDRIDAAYARLHAAAPTLTVGDAVRQEIQLFFARERASLRGQLVAAMDGVVATAQAQLDARLDRAIAVSLGTAAVSARVDAAVTRTVREWLNANLRERVNVTVSATYAPPMGGGLVPTPPLPPARPRAALPAETVAPAPPIQRHRFELLEID